MQRKVQKKFSEVILKLNEEKSFFVETDTKYHGFWVSNNGVRTLFSKYMPSRQFISQPKYVTYDGSWYCIIIIGACCASMKIH